MILEAYRDFSKSKRGRKSLLLRCDQCGKSYTVGYRIHLLTNNHYCEHKCYGLASKEDGVSFKKRSKTNLEKYGFENVFQAEDIKDKIKRVLLDKFGVDNPAKSNIVKSRIRETCIKRFGVENAAQSEISKKNTQKTWKEKYGCHPQQVKEIRMRTERTCQERYGVKRALQNPVFLEKALLTMKKRGTFGKSRSEDSFYGFLCSRFPKKNIERQFRINGWCIDFKVDDTFIQFDGIYWHGLSRPLQEIISSDKLRDKAILRTYKNDKIQNKWFKENNLKLIRVTDKEFEKDGYSITL